MIFLMVNNSDLEARVEALEAGLSLANGDIDNLQDSQIIQDERFLAVETDVTDLEDSFNDLEDSFNGSSPINHLWHCPRFRFSLKYELKYYKEWICSHNLWSLISNHVFME